MREFFDLTGPGSFARLVFLLGVCGLGVAVVSRLLRGRLTSAVSTVLVAGCVVAAILAYTANCGALVRGLTGFTDALAGGAMAAASAALPLEDGRVRGIQDPLNRGLAAAGNAVWTAAVLLPWSWAEFGTGDPSVLALTEEEWEAFAPAIDDKYSSDRTESAAWGAKTVECRWLGKEALAARARSGRLYLDTLVLAL